MKVPHTFWQNEQSVCLLNPKFASQQRQTIEETVNRYKQKNQVWLRSSGTESSGRGIKMVCLSKEAIVNAARSVNHFYAINKKDIWCNPLALFHIGGLSIGARCFESGAQQTLFHNRWQALKFHQTLEKTKATLTSLVPTQVFDLVEAKLFCPSSLRLAFVGAGALDPELYRKARLLHWPLIPVYGMTETSAMIAGASAASLETQKMPKMELLPKTKLKAHGNSFAIETPGLFDFYLWICSSGPVLEKREDPFIVDDCLEYKDGFLQVLARSTELVKVLGETVNLADLSHKISQKTRHNCVVIGQPEPRKGSRLCLFMESNKNPWDLNEINKDLMPFEKITEIHLISQFPRSPTGKILKSRLLKKSTPRSFASLKIRTTKAYNV